MLKMCDNHFPLGKKRSQRQNFLMANRSSLMTINENLQSFIIQKIIKYIQKKKVALMVCVSTSLPGINRLLMLLANAPSISKFFIMICMYFKTLKLPKHLLLFKAIF